MYIILYQWILRYWLFHLYHIYYFQLQWLGHFQHLTLRIINHQTSPPPIPTPLFQVIIELPVIYSNFPLAILHMACIYPSTLISQVISPSPSPPVYTGPFSMSVSLFLPQKQFHQYYFSIFHMHALMCDICFSLLTYFTLHDHSRRSKRERMSVHIQLIHLIVQQKLTQYCKVIILQLKNKEHSAS